MISLRWWENRETVIGKKAKIKQSCGRASQHKTHLEMFQAVKSLNCGRPKIFDNLLLIICVNNFAADWPSHQIRKNLKTPFGKSYDYQEKSTQWKFSSLFHWSSAIRSSQFSLKMKMYAEDESPSCVLFSRSIIVVCCDRNYLSASQRNSKAVNFKEIEWKIAAEIIVETKCFEWCRKSWETRRQHVSRVMFGELFIVL